MNVSLEAPPTLAEIRTARSLLGDRVVTTPTWRWLAGSAEKALGPQAEVHLKMEVWQRAGTFKPRGALLNMLAMDDEARQRGVTAVSAGNHAMAVGYAAGILGTSAKVVMPRTANPARVERCREYGAEVVLVDNVQLAFPEVKRIEREEGRLFVHPFEGPTTVLGTATVGVELLDAVPHLDAVVVPVGGGGLAAGIATAVKALRPECQVFGVEPVGADTLSRSFTAGKPQSIDKVNTIADSLGSPHAAPYTFGLCRRFLDDLVLVDDDALRHSMGLIFDELALAVEPACAAATAALLGPLRSRLQGKKVGLIFCGSNIDLATYWQLLS